MNRSLFAIASLSFRSRLRGWRLAGIGLFAALPGLFAVLYLLFANEASRRARPSFEMLSEMVAPFLITVLAPVASLSLALPALGDHYQNGTMTYLVTRPLSRGRLVAGSWLGTAAVIAVILLVAAVLPASILAPTSAISIGHWALRAGLIALLAILSALPYSAICLFIGAWTKRGAIWALAVLFGWEGLVGSLPGGLRSWSIRRYANAIQREWIGLSEHNQLAASDSSPPGVLHALLVLAGTTILFLILTRQAIRRRDIL